MGFWGLGDTPPPAGDADYCLHDNDNTHYWGERQAFRLGGRVAPFFAAYGTDCLLPKIFRLRQAVNWWKRAPRYRDTRGLADIPSGIDARRFVDKRGETLVTLDNWQQQTGRTLKVDGRTVYIPADPLSIVQVSK
jgi:hypothetical protein